MEQLLEENGVHKERRRRRNKLRGKIIRDIITRIAILRRRRNLMNTNITSNKQYEVKPYKQTITNKTRDKDKSE